MVPILQMVKVLFTHYFEVEDLFCGAFIEPSLFFSVSIFILVFEPVQDDLQHGFIRMAEEADGSVALAELWVSLHRECYYQRLSPLESAILLFYSLYVCKLC